MTVNFLHHLFQTKLECSAVSSDGYSPQNLLSASWRERSQGFLAAHFVKPPVCLLFQFPFAVNVQSLVIKPKVGLQVSSGIDVFVAGIRPLAVNMAPVRSKNARRRNTGRNPTGEESFIDFKAKKRCIEQTNINVKTLAATNEEAYQESGCIPIHKYSTLKTVDSFKDEHRDLFTLVSRTNAHDGKTFRVINRRYGGSLRTDGDIHDMNDIYDFFQAHTLSFVTHFAICINRMNGSCVPALGKVELWGEASPSSTANITKHVLMIHNEILQQDKPSEVHCTANSNDRTHKLTSKEHVKQSVEEDEIPSDFTDPITCSLMTIPMLLPSGLNIDLSTLDKHVDAERTWGRLPSDPFTGVLFSLDVKPLPNGALKARIDKFILSSGVDVQNCGRTVGRSISSKPLQETSLNEKLDHKNGNACYKSLKDVNQEPHNGSLSSEQFDSSQLQNNDDCICCGEDDQEEVQIIGIESHEEKISQSLDYALMKTLQGATFTRRKPSFNVMYKSSLVQNNRQSCSKNGEVQSTSVPAQTRTAGTVHTSSRETLCVGCKVALTTTTAFQLPCKHLLCRKCLTKTMAGKLQCALCGQLFVHKDIIRIHTT